jgi:pimeloyl-ACP methyl ester carboxylesterase
MLSKLNTFLLTVFFLLTWAAGSGLAQTNDSPNLFRINFLVAVRNGVSVDMGALVVANPNLKRGSNILILNGTGQTANTFVPLANAILGDQRLGRQVARVVLLNYPGHGNSGLPVTLSGPTVRFGDLTIDDYVTALINSFTTLNNIGLAPDFLIGHSLGAEVMQLAQQRLVTQGTNMRRQFGITGATFLVPDIAGPLPWLFADGGGGAQAAGAFSRQDPVLGGLLDIPAEAYIQLFFTDLQGRPVPGTPTPDEVRRRGLTSLDSLAMAAQLVGLSGPRPPFQANIFSRRNGTLISIVGLEQNNLYVFPTEHQTVYRFLTGDMTDKMYFPLRGPNTVHNIHIINPEMFIDSIFQTFRRANRMTASTASAN